MYDLIIIGGGPAGAAAGIYAARKKLKTLMIAADFGGQALASGNIENWIGVEKMTGLEFAKMLEKHVRAQESIEIKISEKVVTVEKISDGFDIVTDKNNNYQAKVLIIASGGHRRRLDVPGGAQFEGKGVSYCATCDAPVFKNKRVAVIGGGNAGLETAIDLMPYAEKIYLINRKNFFTGDDALREKIKRFSKMSAIMNADVQKISGEKFVSGIEYLDGGDNLVKKLEVEGVFVEIGSVPNSEFVKHLVETNPKGEVIVNHKTGAASCPGVFAAGDVTDAIYKQNNVSAGDAIKAVLSAHNYLLNIKI